MDHEATDDQLVKAARAGDARAFEALATRHYDMMLRVAYKWCGRREDAEDIAQECCIKLARGLASFKGRARFTSWLYRMTINTAIDWQRAQGRAAATQDMDAFESGGASAEEALYAREVMAQVHALPEKEKTALLLVMAEGLSHAQAADVMDVKESTISWYIFEARKKLGATTQSKERSHG